MKDKRIIRVLILGIIAIIGIVGIQSYWVISTWNINEEEFNQKANYALKRVADQLAALYETELPTRDIIKQRTSNYYVVNMESEIESSNLEYFLSKEFEAAEHILKFFREAKIAARFDHPNLARVYDIGVETNSQRVSLNPPRCPGTSTNCLKSLKQCE